MTEIIGVRFKSGGKQYYFDPNGIAVKAGEGVIIETSRGLEYGECVQANTMVEDEQVVQPLRPMVRIATQKRGTPAFAPIREVASREKKLLEERDFSGFLSCDQEFHMNIAACAGNEILYNLLLTCRKILSFLNAYGMSTIEQMTQVQQEHEELCRTMEAGQSEKAEQLIVEHLRRSEARYRGQKSEKEEPVKE